MSNYITKFKLPNEEVLYLRDAEAQEKLAKLGAQSDWNQNDETANDFIKNRTHYENNELIADDSFNDELGAGFYNTSFDSNPLALGVTYLVKTWSDYNGVEPNEYTAVICEQGENN